MLMGKFNKELINIKRKLFLYSLLNELDNFNISSCRGCNAISKTHLHHLLFNNFAFNRIIGGNLLLYSFSNNIIQYLFYRFVCVDVCLLMDFNSIYYNLFLELGVN